MSIVARAIAAPEAPVERPGRLTRLHEWVVTVDHKRLGIMYVAAGLAFFLIAGLEASVIRWQLAAAGNTVVSPQVFNRLFTVHGTTMIFLVGIPIVFGFANYLVPLMIGARDLAFPRLNAFGFWVFLFGGLLLYFSFLGGDGLYGAGSAPDVGWFAYAPLTGRAFSPGNSTDYWNLSILVTGFGTIATSINLIATILTMRCRGMSLGRMPLYVWMMLVVSGMTVLALPRDEPRAHAAVCLDDARGLRHDGAGAAAAVRRPDHAAARSLPRCPLLRHAGRGLRGHVAALLLVLRPPRGLHPHGPGLRHGLRDHPRLLAKGDLRLPDGRGGLARHRVPVDDGLGPPHVRGRHGRPPEFRVRGVDHADRDPHRDQDLQLGGHDVRRPDPVCHADALRLRVPLPVPVRRPHRHHPLGGAGQLAAHRFLFRRRALPFRAGGQPDLHGLRRDLLLVSEGDRSNAERAAGSPALLA